MSQNQKSKPTPLPFNPGSEIFRWKTQDYHPYQRGIVWYLVMGFIVLGGAAWALFFTDWGWLSALCILLAAGVYLQTHFGGPKEQEVVVYTEGFVINDRDIFTWDQFRGFWIMYDPHVSVIHFERKHKKGRITIQLGPLTREDMLGVMKQVTLGELENERESVTDLWIRALKL